MRKNVFTNVLMTSMICILLVGCSATGEESFDETTISVDKKGRISETIVETFDKDYYNVDELKTEFDELINNYNSAQNSESVKLKKCEFDEGRVFVTVDFESAKDYVGLLNEDMFYGTINEAYDAGYQMSITMKGIADGDKIGKVEIMGMKDRHIVVLSEPVVLRVSEPISYVSANIEVLSDKEVRVLSESGGLAYVILSK